MAETRCICQQKTIWNVRNNKKTISLKKSLQFFGPNQLSIQLETKKAEVVSFKSYIRRFSKINAVIANMNKLSYKNFKQICKYIKKEQLYSLESMYLIIS